jgi:mRNA interferase MazF
VKRGEIWWANLGPHRPHEQTGRRPVVVWQNDKLTTVLHSVVIIPLTTNLERAGFAGTSLITASELGPPQDSVALAYQIRTVSKSALESRMRALDEAEIADLEFAAAEAFGGRDIRLN